MRTLELLAPAKNVACGLAAIDCGADAVYIGAAHHGARMAAGNTTDDIKTLCDYAHRFNAKVYVTVNTIVYDHELDDTLQLIAQLQSTGVDALLLQDMGLVGKTAMPIHASTQCDTRTAEKVQWLRSLGFSRVVLARELSAEEIAAIHKAAPDVELEVFVHGALCVSYSGVCYASQHCFHRSANRGECAQFCRLKFDLVDDNGREIVHQRHLLSLKDLCQIDSLERLAAAGACSFKIEGRLKDENYVKNVVSAYSQRLDELVRQHPDLYRRSSLGRTTHFFQPNLKKTFNRGYTHYFLDGRQPNIASFDTPKAIGEYVGKVKDARANMIVVAGTAQFANGDGLCYFNPSGELEGFRVNRAVGNHLYPQRMPQSLRPGTPLYRNNDVEFEKLLSGKSSERRIPITLSLSLTEKGFLLQAADVAYECEFDHQPARNNQRENIQKQLSKLGATAYTCEEVVLGEGVDSCFIPSSLLAEMRRQLVERLDAASAHASGSPCAPRGDVRLPQGWQREYIQYPYLYNIANREAQSLYAAQGLKHIEPAFELSPRRNALIMQCRHCLRYALGHCVKRGGNPPAWKEPLRLRLADGRTFPLRFMCDECQMNVYAED